jgi:hypothetical protein
MTGSLAQRCVHLARRLWETARTEGNCANNIDPDGVTTLVNRRASGFMRAAVDRRGSGAGTENGIPRA